MSGINNDIRWKQRFQNYRKSFNRLWTVQKDNDVGEYSLLEQEGIVRRFGCTFELGWKTFKDYLEFSGMELIETTPRKVIKVCAATGIFNEAGIDGNIYLDMMFFRNATARIYEYNQFASIISKIKNDYLPELGKEYTFFENMA